MDLLTTAGPPHEWRQTVLAAIRSMPGALASHRTAAALWGLEGFPPDAVEVATERCHRRPPSPGTTVHHTTDLVAGDVDERHGILCTSLVRTLVDLPTVAHHSCCGRALDHVVGADHLLLRRVRRRHVELARPDRPGAASLRALLTERGEGEGMALAGFEDQALRLIGGSCLPRPEVRWGVHDDDFGCSLDLAWPELHVAVECDSREHRLGHAAFRWDRMRRWQLHRLGWRVLEFTYDEVTRSGPLVLREIAAHLAQRRRTRPL